MANSNFYTELDLRYPEIAIAMDDIDILNPGMTRFIIPILTPGVVMTKPVSNTVYQSKHNLMNSNKAAFEINNIRMKNYITLPVTREVCGTNLMNYIFDTNSDEYYKFISNIPDNQRYIRRGSKWIVIFIGGDITNPSIIGRYNNQ